MKPNKLHNINKTGYKAPENYFKNLEDQIMSRIKLSKLDNTGFKMPNDYFNPIESRRVIHTISREKKTKVIPLYSNQNIIYISGIAVAILLLLNLSIFKKDSWNIEAQIVENYIIDETTSSYKIASLLEDEDLIEANFVSHNFSDKNIENYVINNVDIQELILE